MNQPFEIRFDFALAHSDLIISLTATAEPHHSDLYYIIDHFHFAGIKPAEDHISILPAQEITQVERAGKKVWVHKDSERESMLSLAVGKAIENVKKERKNGT